MNKADALKWLSELEVTGDSLPMYTSRSSSSPSTISLDPQAAAAWANEAESALESIFPSGHPTRRRWTTLMSGQDAVRSYSKTHIQQGVGIVRSAVALVRNDRLSRLVDGIRAETVSEVLEQAGVFLKQGYLIAAAVLAGGALETHLLHLCSRNSVTWQGDGSIAKYDQAIGQARNGGTEIYAVTESKAVIGWGDIRNKAAHEPTKFDRSTAEVGLMIEGIRQFLARVP